MRTTDTADELRADLILRSVWLRALAHQLYDLEAAEDRRCSARCSHCEDLVRLGRDGTLGQAAANLLDFSDLLQVADREGRRRR